MSLAAMKVPFLDLRVPKEEQKPILDAVEKVLSHGRFILGPEVAELETRIARRCGRKFGIGSGSGSDALFLALKALGIGPGDEVITTSLSWIATANAIAMTGATPVFADILDDLTIDPDHAASLVTGRTKALLPVHFTGKMCQMDALGSLAEKKGIILIEDAAQSFGAAYRDRPAGSFGKISCFSMNPMKLLAACGEAGMLLTDDPAIHERLIALRYNGTINREECIETSLNCRLDTIQAAILLARLELVDEVIEKRRAAAAFYNQRLSSFVKTPPQLPHQKDVYYTYQIQTGKRDELRKFLEERHIETKVQYEILMCQQAPYRKHLRSPVRNAERLSREMLCLPMHEKLSLEELEHVAQSIEVFFSHDIARRV